MLKRSTYDKKSVCQLESRQVGLIWDKSGSLCLCGRRQIVSETIKKNLIRFNSKMDLETMSEIFIIRFVAATKEKTFKVNCDLQDHIADCFIAESVM